jgi:hypothetical protein
MRIDVDLTRCTGHGICETIAADVFEASDDGRVHPRQPAGLRPDPDAAGRNPVPGRRAAADRGRRMKKYFGHTLLYLHETIALGSERAEGSPTTSPPSTSR